ncbi:uncharacterized protein KY384_008017 [Bacidia gigantensis]|uniref:uncharacterized protein n=1 Tax=Bacidia gigantensis TaxID=2732470 RepID=UPI001D047D8E|nr:uncharacterized protein KY384_008017 [Bacidia gigantensis]KAG8527273.1 hypothetical protein KY384_008017 [Bacidia gigantensis]
MDISSGVIVWYDSLAASASSRRHKTEAEATLEAFGEFLSQHNTIDDQIWWSFTPASNGLQQHNADDCGIFCLVWALTRVIGEPTPSNDFHDHFWRSLFQALIDPCSQRISLTENMEDDLTPDYTRVASILSPDASFSDLLAATLQHTEAISEYLHKRTQQLSSRIEELHAEIKILQQGLRLASAWVSRKESRVTADISTIARLQEQETMYQQMLSTLDAKHADVGRARVEDSITDTIAEICSGMKKVQKEQRRLGDVLGNWQRVKKYCEAEEHRLWAEIEQNQQVGRALKEQVFGYCQQQKERVVGLFTSVNELGS